MSWYLTVLKNYARFSGRARRKEFWIFTLFNFIIGALLEVISANLNLGSYVIAADLNLGSYLGLIFNLAVLIPGLAVGVRRLHDTGRSGWWLLFLVVPLAGIGLLFMWAAKGEPGDNAYGPDPKLAPALG